ncbi:uncharacterized protein EV420DRAFT_1637835 [Desarmillaria tabescens]|uniref:Uncharacterized protein n=1 Tax=Armillaria tabescens TaxID=1929756 RepID=A0AA39NER4_ARMTA|nr:uncharacterized protein EV420DRAFT_1637835 [Desarmillaria tabescens]KAK0464271.1 hypothetical protein EV420DRAFT_1637835 [Desarmillaria tabescens]
MDVIDFQWEHLLESSPERSLPTVTVKDAPSCTKISGMATSSTSISIATGILAFSIVSTAPGSGISLVSLIIPVIPIAPFSLAF